MKKYGIFHPLGGALNSFLRENLYVYEYITTVEAENINDVFFLVQNDLNEAYAKLDKRSTSVGDIILELSTGKRYFVAGVGHKETQELLSGELQHLIESHQESIADFHNDQEVTNGHA